jgi:Tol biopolymer transport system component
MNADGSNQTALTTNSSQDWTPAWSPDGKKVVFWRKELGPDDDEIVKIGAGGANETTLTNNVMEDQWPDWQPLP